MEAEALAPATVPEAAAEVAAQQAPPVPMSPRTRTALGVTGAAVALGALGDALLRPTPWGANLALWTLALAAAALGLQRWADADEVEVGWVPLAVGVAVLTAWRDSPTLKGLDVMALLVILGLAVHRAYGGAIRLGGIASYALGLFEAAVEAMAGAVRLVARDVRWSELPRGRWTKTITAVGLGAAIAAPLLLVFGALLTAADAAFERLVSSALSFDAPLTISHLFLAGTFAWLAGSVLRALVLGEERRLLKPPARPKALSLGIVETGTVLGLLNVLFAAFVVVQLPYFFGGAAMIEAPGTTTFSEYARRGFFELVTVSALVLPMLLGLHWLLRKDDARHERAFRALAGAQVALLVVIMASALHRMRLYTGAYGLTELRLYTTAFMLWLAAVFGWFAWTVLRGRRERFAFGALLAALETTVVLHAVSPDALIVRLNAARPDAAARFDAAYAASLSADAVPALVAALPKVAGDSACVAATRLLERWSEGGDWRAWSLGRARATRAVHAHQRELRAMACADPQAVTVDVVLPEYR